MRATGYGIMNLVSISCGGFADWAGAKRDRLVPLPVIFGVFAVYRLDLRGDRARHLDRGRTWHQGTEPDAALPSEIDSPPGRDMQVSLIGSIFGVFGWAPTPSTQGPIASTFSINGIERTSGILSGPSAIPFRY